jgi:hypothetical protein
MTSSEIAGVRRAIALLSSLVDEPCAAASSGRCPVRAFISKYFVREPSSAVSTLELWQFYTEVVDAGEADRLTKQVFLRRLTSVMAAVFGVKKSHNITTPTGRARGFRGIGYDQSDWPIRAENYQPAIFPEVIFEPDLSLPPVVPDPDKPVIVPPWAVPPNLGPN